MFVSQRKRRSWGRKKGGMHQGVHECHRWKRTLPPGITGTLALGIYEHKRSQDRGRAMQQPHETTKVEMCPCVHHKNATGPSLPPFYFILFYEKERNRESEIGGKAERGRAWSLM